MPNRSRSLYRVVALVLPRDFRHAAGAGLEDAAVECLRRERTRFGRLGLASGWLALIADAVATSAALRVSAAVSSPTPWSTAATAYSTPGRIEVLMDNVRNDLRHALRGLRRQPGFTLITTLTLALGIGANTAIFSVVNGVLLRPLGYPEPDRLEFITSQFPGLGFDQFWLTLPEFLEFRDHNESFTSVGAYAIRAANLGTDPPTRPVLGLVTPELMPTLGVRPLAGRWFSNEDARPGAERVAILSWELWQREYGADPTVLGRVVQANDLATRVVGIMPPGYDLHDQRVELWEPLTIDPTTLVAARGGHFLYLVGRLKDGLAPAQAKADVARMLAQWTQFAPYAAADVPDPKKHQIRLDPLKDDIVGGVRTALVVLQAAVVFVLLIACANLANLLLARAESRQREFAVRSALGAGRGRLLRQFVTEGHVLAFLAASVGIGLGWAALRALITVNPDAIPRSAAIALDWRVLAFTLALAVTTGFVFGLAPLVHLGGRLAEALRDGTRTTSGRMQKAVRAGLVVAEVSLAVVLVVGAGLLLKSFANLLNVDAGFNRSHLVTFSIVLPRAAYTPERGVATLAQLEDRIRTLPGVQSVSSMNGLPPNRPVNANDTAFEFRPAGNADPNLPPANVDYYQYVTARYTETMGIPIVRGRNFEPRDAGAAPVMLINEALARRFFPDRDPIGQRLDPQFTNDKRWYAVIGVVKDVKQGGVDAQTGTELYLLNDQLPKAAGSAAWP